MSENFTPHEGESKLSPESKSMINFLDELSDLDIREKISNLLMEFSHFSLNANHSTLNEEVVRQKLQVLLDSEQGKILMTEEIFSEAVNHFKRAWEIEN